VARQTQFQVILAASPTDPQPVDLLLPDGQRMVSRVAALQYWDAGANKAVRLATVRDVAGELLTPTRVVFADAFASVIEGVALTADLEYVLGLDGLHQNVLVRGPLPDPADLGLNSEHVRLEVWSEFLQAPAPQVDSVLVWAEPDPAVRAQLAEPDWIEDRLDFGPMLMPMGRGFVAKDELAEPAVLPMLKHWVEIDGRQWLIEQTPYVEIARAVAQAGREREGEVAGTGHLPGRVFATEAARGFAGASLAAQSRTGGSPGRSGKMPELRLLSTGGAAKDGVLAAGHRAKREPPRAVASAAPTKHRAVAQAGAPSHIDNQKSKSPWLSLDYQVLLTQTNVVLKGDTTWWITNTVNLSGSANVLEGGAVLKFNSGGSAAINVYGTLLSQTSPYRPAIFTAKDDTSVGESLPGSNTNNLTTTYYSNPALYFDGASSDVRYVRIAHAQQGIRYNFFGTHTVSHAQFVRCQKALLPYYATVHARNVLVQNASSVFDSSTHPMVAHCEHLSVNTASYLASAGSLGSAVHATNCVFASVTSLQPNANITFDGLKNGFYPATPSFGTSPTTANGPPFKAVGQGFHYLADGSNLRDAGTTAINATLLTDLTKRTTYAPLILSGPFSSATTLAPQALRDTDTPDLGYHYDPLDYCWSGLNLTNSATLVLTNGVAVGIYGAKGTTLYSGTQFVSEGSPTALNRLVRYELVQEQSWPWGTLSSTRGLFDLPGYYSPAPIVRLTFTDVSVPAGASSTRYLVSGFENAYNPLGTCALSHSQLRGLYQPFRTFATGCTFTLTNNLIDRSTLTFEQGYTGYYTFAGFGLSLYNNLFHLAAQTFKSGSGGSPWTIKDNLFDADSLTVSGTYNVTADYNGYRSGLASLGGNNNKTGLVMDWQSGPGTNLFGVLGNYYYPTSGATYGLTNLLNTGSRNATNAGLYHFTTTTDQVKEGGTQVDIGYHYVALNANNLPVDTDNEGLADYFEDRNGNGVQDGGETRINDTDTDYDGRNDYQEYADATDPLSANSVRPVRLGYWRFNTSDWKGEQGQLPTAANNLQLVASYEGNGVQITNGSAILKYRDVEANGLPNLNLRSGAIRLRYKPYWRSVNDGGAGPGQPVRLVQVGSVGAGAYFDLSIDASGTNVVFSCSDGTNVYSRSGWIDFVWEPATGTGPWSELRLVFSLTSSSVWQDGYVMIPPDTNSLPLVPASVRALGFTVGCSTSGAHQAQGIVDELETFNFPAPNYGNASRLSGSVTASPPSISLYWDSATNCVTYVKRRLAHETTWSVLPVVVGTNLLDTNVAVGQRYEYQLGTRTVLPGQEDVSVPNFLLSAISAPPVDPRGKVIMVVDNTMTNALASELLTLKTNLVGDGWTVARIDAPRHNDTNWVGNTNNIAWVKSNIVSNFDASTTNLVFIIGHVVVPYSGKTASDNHVGQTEGGQYLGDHRGAWVADAYYGTITNSLWTDSTVTQLNQDYPAVMNNVPGDGKFDNDRVPSWMQLGVGRVDFANLPVFNTGTNPLTEAQLLSRYLQKNHQFRHKITTVQDRFVEGAYFSGAAADLNESVHAEAWRTASRLFPFEAAPVVTADFFLETTSFWCGFLGGRGSTPTIQGDNTTHFSSDLVNPANEPRGAFYLINGSWFADWNLGTDNLLRSLTATANFGLGAIGYSTPGVPYLALHALGLGEPFGVAMARNLDVRYPQGHRWETVIGDPTLRLHVSAPASNLSGNNGTNVALTWTASPETSIQYVVYRSQNNLDGPWAKLGGTSSTSFTDNPAPSGAKMYQVRALKPLVTGSGSFTNQSQGIFVNLN
jgi:hypothetical protein